jgi:membrane protein required for colicin V production
VLAFVACIFAGSLLAFLMKKLISVVGLSPADRGLGALFGATRGLVLLLAITVVVGMTPMRMSVWWQEATGPALTAVVLKGLQPLLPQEFAKYLP